MGGSISSLFGNTEEEQPYQDYLQLTDLGGFLAKYIFLMLDKEKKKRISKKEYLTLLNHFREKKTSEAELDEFLRKCVDQGASIEYIDERLFKRCILQLAIDFDQNAKARMRYLMTLFDKDCDGFVSESDLRGVYATIGIQVPPEPIHSLVQKYDKDKDGKLSELEFERLGRSAMHKLFVKRDARSIADILVEEALKKGSASIFDSDGALACGEGSGLNTATRSLESYHEIEKRRNRIPSRDVNNNNMLIDSADVDSMTLMKPKKLHNTSTTSSVFSHGVVFAKPLELQSNSSLFSDIEETPSTNNNNISLLGKVLRTISTSSEVTHSGDSSASLEGILSELDLEDIED